MFELYVLRGVAVCLWSNTIKAGSMPIATLPLLNGPNVSTTASEDKTLKIVLHSV